MIDNFDEDGIILEPVGSDAAVGVEVTESMIDYEDRANDPDFMPPHLKEGIPPVTCNFGKSDYWDGRYSRNPDTFEWYHEVRKNTRVAQLKGPPGYALTPTNKTTTPKKTSTVP